MELVAFLLPACSRIRTGLWFVTALIGFSIRTDMFGVTSFVRVLGLKERCYDRLLDLFHSPALNLDNLTTRWVSFVLSKFPVITKNGRIVLLGDGLKAPKTGRKMPAVKKLHQESQNNNKPEYIMGHSCQAIGLLVGTANNAFSVPLSARIHEGLVFSNRDKSTQLDKMISLLRSLKICSSGYFVADAYYACAPIIRGLLKEGHHLVSRVRRNAVAYKQPIAPTANEKKRRGPKKKYGDKIALITLFDDKSSMDVIDSPLPGEKDIHIPFRSMDLIWRRVGLLIRFVAICHPVRGSILLMTTDLTLSVPDILELYAWRFKIEVSFKQAVRTIGSFAYHFWMKMMKRIKRETGDQYLHRETKEYREAIVRKIEAYHRFIQVGLIAQGLLQYLSCHHAAAIWSAHGTWLRTIRPDRWPSEMLTAVCLRNLFPEYLVGKAKNLIIVNFLRSHLDLERAEGMRLVA